MTFVLVCGVEREPGGIRDAASQVCITGVGPPTHKNPFLLQVFGVEQFRPAVIGVMPGQHSALKTIGIGGPAGTVFPASEINSYFAGVYFRPARNCRMVYACETEARSTY